MVAAQGINSPFFNLSIKDGVHTFDQNFFGNGKVLLSGEYFVLDGADALALPTQAGQSLSVKYERSYNPTLSWHAFDSNGESWFKADFEFWNFEIINEDQRNDDRVLFLQKLLKQSRKQNKHFLREEVKVHVETRLGFPKEWGLGSSSSLIYNLAQWAYVSPFELLFKTTKGSGYDVACAQSEGAILYNLGSSGPLWSPVVFNPSFRENLYFVYLGKKQNTQKEIGNYENLPNPRLSTVSDVSALTREMLACSGVTEFNRLMEEHEKIVGRFLGREPIKNEYFEDFSGQVKSLGAWGGDFMLASSNRPKIEVEKYFNNKGLKVIIPYEKIILSASESETKKINDRVVH